MKRIGLVDFSYFLRVAYHSRANDSSPNECGQHTLNQLSDFRRNFDHLVVCLDSPPYWRKKVHEGYKSSRERDDSYMAICKWTKDRLVKDGYSIASAPTFEADDVMATLARLLPAKGFAVSLITADKDSLQLVTADVRAMAPTGQGQYEERDVAWVVAKYGVRPDQMALLQAIAGDGSDDIPGIQGIGPKGAAKLINEYGTIAAMRVAAVAALEASQKPGAKPLSAGWTKFLAGSPKLSEWLELTTLRTDVTLDVDALLVRQPVQKLVEEEMVFDPEDDGRPPSEEDLEEERELLAPEDAISSPKASGGQSSGSMPQSYASATRGQGDADPKADRARHVENAASAGGTTTAPSAASDGGRASAQTVTRSDPKATAADAPASTAASNGHSNGGARRSERASGNGEAIVVSRPAPSWALQLQPATVAETIKLCSLLHNSRFLSQFGSERGIMTVVLMGRELGLGAMTSLELFHIVKDRPYPKAKGLRYLAERDPNCEWIQVVSADDRHATIKTKHRKAGLLEYTYTIERAQRAGYLTGPNKHNWNTITQEMLEARATSKGVNRWYSGATFGMPSAEEVMDREESDE